PLVILWVERGQRLTWCLACMDEDLMQVVVLNYSSRSVILPMGETLKQNGIGNGSRLVLV
ncbi:MAG: hypothetical protein LUD53_07450, partial [Clostridiales bacterium]|nr:hypothetical protein [Clostridiales bacterium]